MSFVEFSVKGFPPAYDSGFSITNKAHSRYPLVLRLQTRAEEAMSGKELLQGDLAIDVKCEARLGHRRTDAVNLLAGIANVLEKIAYTNDNQIKEIHFKQVFSEEDAYKVKIKQLTREE